LPIAAQTLKAPLIGIQFRVHGGHSFVPLRRI
jgi:hypothetical protein